MTALPEVGAVGEYWRDACQRSVLLLDVLRQRGNAYFEHQAREVPHVLSFQAELIRDGRTLPRPVNYLLARIVPPVGTRIDARKPPFIVVDPRAGHGPGIGGMKQDSEIGVALAAGHPCYFIGFSTEPVPGQTVEDVCRAEAAFVEEVAARHPEAEGKPVVIANCQAGWQILMMAALRPELTGPVLVAGSPLSYWAGVRGKNPLRYLGGLLGGTWLTALAGDVGGGIFDGAQLIANFESLDPANTYWKKIYNVYSKVDTEAPRFLDFETWWGSPVLLNAEEMQWIADNLFVGNKLTAGELRTSDGQTIDLRNITSPIVVLCSWGDNITPPQQALGWVTDLYRDEKEIAANSQTIVYTLHESIGHLGIFVSGKVATKQHAEIASCMELIDLMPPGLYEAVITEVEEDIGNPELIEGKYLFRLEARTLADIRALGTNSPEDERRFATAARVSEVNLGLYRATAGRWMRSLFPGPVAEALRQLHPHRMRFAWFSDRNPLMWPVKGLADWVRTTRTPASKGNPFSTVEAAVSSGVAYALEGLGAARDAMSEAIFLNVYGSPLLQALVGLNPPASPSGQSVEGSKSRPPAGTQRRAELEQRFERGGLAEALVRAVLYIRLPEGSADERGLAMLRALRAAQPAGTRLSPTQLKEVVKTQFLLLDLDQERALRTLPKLLPRGRAERRAGLELVQRMLSARGALSPAGQRRLVDVEAVFDAEGEVPLRPETVHA
ncbi:MAG: DUF3141 domain-containing protein [Myxococcaceae bacterium]